MKNYVFTCGDINGIGPEIAIKAINKIYDPGKQRIFFLCPANVFEIACGIAKADFDFEINKKIKPDASIVQVINIGDAKTEPGVPSKKSGKISIKAIEKACDLLYTGKADAVITAPVSKTAIALAGYNSPGQTEIFADYFYSKNFMMVFLSDILKGGLATIHEPIRKVSALLSRDLLLKKIEVIVISLILDFGIQDPKIAILGLNPHAGENGNIGNEEKKIIIPAIAKSEFKQFLSGPFVPDAFFAAKMYEKYDAVIAMYHDQLLIPFKMLSFAAGVNYTAGLPVIRTSPDHGTAYDIAYKGVADESSMISAFRYAELISENRNRIKHFGKPTI